MQRGVEVLCALKRICILAQRLCDCGIEHDVGACDAVRGAEHTELELVARECKGRGTVTVGGVAREFRQHLYSELHYRLFRALVRLVLLERLENGGQLVAEEHRNYCGRCLVSAETVVIARGSDRETEQTLVVVYCLNYCAEEYEELCIVMWGIAGGKQVNSGVRSYRPVVVLTAAVYARKGLLVQQADEPVTGRDLLHYLHCQLVVVGCNVCSGIDRRKLMLCGCDLVVLGLCENSELPELLVKISHVFGNSRLDSAEIMVVKLLTLRRLCTEKRSAAELEVGTLLVHFLIYKEVFLLGSYRGANTGRVGVAEQLEYTHSLLVQRLHGAKKRSLFIERLAAVRAECSRNAERLILYECIGGRVPCGVAARLKGRTQTAGGKG